MGCISSPVDSNSRKSENGHVYGDGLDQEHQVAHEASEGPAVGTESVGQREGHAGHAHQHVREGQVADEEVGDVVHLSGAADDIDQKVVAEDAHQHHENVAGYDERFEGLQEGYICERVVVRGRGVLDHRHLVDVGLRVLVFTWQTRSLHPPQSSLKAPPAGHKDYH